MDTIFLQEAYSQLSIIRYRCVLSSVHEINESSLEKEKMNYDNENYILSLINIAESRFNEKIIIERIILLPSSIMHGLQTRQHNIRLVVYKYNLAQLMMSDCCIFM